LIADLEREVEQITMQMNHAHCTEAKKYALKKSAALKKSEIIKERRRIKLQGQGQGQAGGFKATF